MKMNVLRHLVLPWLLLFGLTISAIVVAGVDFHINAKYHQFYIGLLGLGVFLCLVSNFRTLSKAGIWIAHSLPRSLRNSPWGWIGRALLAGAIALGFYLVGQLPWIPLIWQAVVIPVVFAITLFVGVWSLMGPILTWSSQVAFSRFTAFFLGLPVFALVPITALFLGQMILTAYQASRPELTVMPDVTEAVNVDTTQAKATKPPTKAEMTAREKNALAFQKLAEAGKPCPDDTKEVQAALSPSGPEEVVYWAVKAVKCTEMKSVVGLPKLVKVMLEHPSPRVRAASIQAMMKFGTENVRRVGYLLVKRIAEKEPAEVIEAAAPVLARLGDDERKWATSRLKNLLDSPKASSVAADVLVEDLKRDDLVAEFVSDHLAENSEARNRAIGMICSLPPNSRAVAEAHIDGVVSAIKTGSEDDPAIEALECLGPSGFQAIRQEVLKPQRLQRPVAAKALAEMNVKTAPEILDTANTCAHDEDEQVRHWCSQTLGKIGAPALPQILDLLKSNNSALKDAGKNALNFFDDPAAKQELAKIRAENSGWMANKKKLQIAKAVDNALLKIASEENQSPAPPQAAPANSNKSVQ